MDSRRVLVTGISTFWGGRLAQAVESHPAVEVVIGVDDREPTCELERTEFVKISNQHRLIQRIVEAADVDTVVDTRLVVDSTSTSPRRAHENNVIGTMNILAGCSGASSPVRKFVFKSSAHFYGAEQDDPSFFTEDMPRPHPARAPIERDIVEAERAVADFAARSASTTVTVLRFVNGIGPDLHTAHMKMLGLPAVPMILGFDPRYQFVHEDDIVAALDHAVWEDLPGVYNVAADGVLALSEVIGLLGKRPLPILPPWRTELVAGQVLGRLGLHLPPEMLRQMRFGRGLDNRRFKATGFEYHFTTREAVLDLAAQQRTARIRSGRDAEYVYEHEVEQFLRHSPSVRRRAALRAAEGGDGNGRLAAYDHLGAEEIVKVLPSLDRRDLEDLRGYEERHRARATVLRAIDRQLARAG